LGFNDLDAILGASRTALVAMLLLGCSETNERRGSIHLVEA
jgi:hypothetical protein